MGAVLAVCECDSFRYILNDGNDMWIIACGTCHLAVASAGPERLSRLGSEPGPMTR